MGQTDSPITCLTFGNFVRDRHYLISVCRLNKALLLLFGASTLISSQRNLGNALAEASTLIKASYLLTANLGGFHEARKVISSLSIAVKSYDWKRDRVTGQGDTCWCLSSLFLPASSYGHILFLSHSDY